MKSGNQKSLNIVYLKNKNIDKSKWDECIDKASNGLIYGYSFYLDAMAKHWDALVLNEYEAVMPLPWNKKYNLSYLYQPFTCAALGVFGKSITPGIINLFLEKIPKNFKYWDIYLNNKMSTPVNKSFKTFSRVNYILDLNKPYDLLYKKFRNSYKHLIKKSLAKEIIIKQNVSIKEITLLALQTFKKISNVNAVDIKNFEKLYQILFKKNKATNFSVFLKDTLLASGIFFFSHERAYYVMAGNKKEGREVGASHIVINSFISKYAETPLLLDFEGSNVTEIAFFFKGFGAQPEEYTGLKYNSLPFFLKPFKK